MAVPKALIQVQWDKNLFYLKAGNLWDQKAGKNKIHQLELNAGLVQKN